MEGPNIKGLLEKSNIDDESQSVAPALQVLATTASNAANSALTNECKRDVHIGNDSSLELYYPSMQDNIHDQSTICSVTNEPRRSVSYEISKEEVRSLDVIDVGSEDDLASRNSGSSDEKHSTISGMRKGKWTVEEEEYATRVIHYFSTGILTLPDGETLRSYLAKKLQCYPRRITKKYAGASCLGKRILDLCRSPEFSNEEVETACKEIDRLEQRFRLSLKRGAEVSSLHSTGSISMSTNTQAIQLNTTTNQSDFGQMNLFQQGVMPNNEQYILQRKSSISPNASNISQCPFITTVNGNNQASAVLKTLAENAQLAAAEYSSIINTAPTDNVPVTTSTPISFMPLIYYGLSHPATLSALPQVHQSQLTHIHPSLGLAWQNDEKASTVMAPPSANSRLKAYNEELAEALITQISTVLIALAAISPSSLQRIKTQLITAALSPDPSAFLNIFQHLSQNADSPKQQSGGLPSPAKPSPTPLQAYSSLPNLPCSSNQRLASSTSESFFPQRSSNCSSKPCQQHNQAPSTADTHQKKSKTEPVQCKNYIPTLALEASSKVSSSRSSNVDALTSNMCMNALLDTLRKGHAEALKKVERDVDKNWRENNPKTHLCGNLMVESLIEQKKYNHSKRIETSESAGKGLSPNRVESTPFFEALSRNNSSPTILTNGNDPNSSTQNLTVANGGAFFPFERSVAVSSESGYTTYPFDTEESASSAENITSGEAKTNDSTSSNSLSDDEKDNEQSKGRACHKSVPLRKRFKASSDNFEVGITSRNLADHNVRMQEIDALNRKNSL